MHLTDRETAFYLRLLLLIGCGTVVFAGTDTSKPWELQWRRSIISLADLKLRASVIEKVIVPEMQKRRNVRFDLGKRNPAYDAIDPTKVATPLCKIYMQRIVKQILPGQSEATDGLGKGGFTCSCAFVRPNLVITAAHCFFDDVWGEVVPNKGWVVYVIQGYGGKGDKSVTYSYADYNMAVEWWVNLFYDKSDGKSDVIQGMYDFAFVRTEKESVGRATYGLSKSKEAVGREIHILGYSSEYMKGEVASLLTGKAHLLDNFPGQIAFEAGEKVQADVGGSGGPWLLADETGDARDMFSLSSWVPTENTVKILDYVTFGPQISLRLIRAAKQINKYPKAGDKTNTGAVEVTLTD